MTRYRLMDNGEWVDVREIRESRPERTADQHGNRYGGLCLSLEPGAPGFKYYDPETGRGIIDSAATIANIEAIHGLEWTR